MDLPETDSEDELPPAWEERVTFDGSVFYVNHVSQETQWTHPRTNRKKFVSGELPHNWEKLIDDNRKISYRNIETGQETYTDPRLVFAVEEKKHPYDFRQKFDASSTALKVLHGKDLTGTVAIVTGANCGIGFETFRTLVKHNCSVVLGCRDIQKAKDAVKRVVDEKAVKKDLSSLCDVIHLDLASLESTRKFSAEFQKRYKKLDLLILNAAVFGIGYETTVDNLEMNFQVNYLSHFYLTLLLIGLLRKDGRIILLASESHRFSDLNITNICREKLSVDAREYSPLAAYNTSKLCIVLFAMELAKNVNPNRNLSVFAVHPGNVVSSNLSRNWWVWRTIFGFVRPFTKSLQQAASTTIYCATCSDLNGLTGLYVNNCCICQASDAAYDDELARELWIISERLIKERMGVKAFQLVDQ